MTLWYSVIFRVGTVHCSHGYSKYRFVVYISCTATQIFFCHHCFPFIYHLLLWSVIPSKLRKYTLSSTSKSHYALRLFGFLSPRLTGKRKSCTVYNLRSFANQSERKLKSSEEMTVKWVGGGKLVTERQRSCWPWESGTALNPSCPLTETTASHQPQQLHR